MLKTIQILCAFAIWMAFASCQKKGNPEELLKEARTAMQAKDSKKAVELLSQIIDIDGNHAEALNMRGVANISLNDLAQATADFDKAISIDPSNQKYYYNRANIKLSMQLHAEAADDYTKALALDSTKYELWLSRAMCYVAAQKGQEALADFAGAIRHGGAQDARIHFSKGQLLVSLNQYQDAIPCFETCVAINKDDAESYFLLGETQIKAGTAAAKGCDNLKKSLELGYEEAAHAIVEHCSKQ